MDMTCDHDTAVQVSALVICNKIHTKGNLLEKLVPASIQKNFKKGI